MPIGPQIGVGVGSRIGASVGSGIGANLFSFAVVTPTYSALDIAWWGDSLTAGSINPSVLPAPPANLAVITGDSVFNGGVGGNTSTQIATRQQADGTHSTWPVIIWAGRNNFSAPTTVESDIATMCSEAHLVMAILNANNDQEWIGQANYVEIATLNAALLSTYGANFVDIRSYLVSLYNPNNPTDVTDFGHDVSPTSLRAVVGGTPDTLHPGAQGNIYIAAFMANFLGAL